MLEGTSNTDKRRLRLTTPMILLFWLGVVGLTLALSRGFLNLQLAERVSHSIRLFAGKVETRGQSSSARVDASTAPVATTEQASAIDPLTTRNASGWLRTISHEGAIDTNNAFFRSLGTNGRSCNSCHVQSAAWSITPSEVQARFEATDGLDPIFRVNDGSNSPNADVSTVAARRSAYSMLLRRGLIRIGIGIPATAEFTLAGVDDPYGHASAAELSLFRRPLPATNLVFLTGVMWDDRETITPFLPPMHAGENASALQTALIQQATNATLGHGQAGSPPSPEQLAEIVSFETGLTTAQIEDDAAGFLNADDAIGGPRVLAQQRFHVGINDTQGADPTGAIFDPAAMSLYAAWGQANQSPRPRPVAEPFEPFEREGLFTRERTERLFTLEPEEGLFTHRFVDIVSQRSLARASIARGEQLFNLRPMDIDGVGGFNDVLGEGNVKGTCTSCHNSPNVGSQSVGLPQNLGLTDASRRTPDMPLYTLRNKTTGATVQTTDPGLALTTGKWKDIGRFKGTPLRGLAARPPFFHNGFAASLEEVVDFYDDRFHMNLSSQEKRDLVAFMRSL